MEYKSQEIPIKRMIYHSTEKRIKNISEVKKELSRILEKV